MILSSIDNAIGVAEVLALTDDLDEFRVVVPKAGDILALKNALAQVSGFTYCLTCTVKNLLR